jgi:hypothetical protein
MAIQNNLLSLMRGIADIYLSIFVLFFRVSRWRTSSKASSAVVGVAVVDYVLALSLVIWAAIMTGHPLKLSPWVVGIIFLIFCSANYRFLVIRSHGVAFEKQFCGFQKSKQTTLLSVAAGILLATVAIFSFSIQAYHRTFGIR